MQLVLHDVDAGVRSEAATTLGGFGADPQGLAALTSALRDPDPEVQRAAGAALPADVAALPALKDALHHPSTEVRRRAADTFRGFGTPSREVLLALASALGDPDAGVRTAAAQSAAVIGKHQPLLGPPLLQALRSEGDAFRRTFLVHALLETGGVTQAELPLLLQLLKSDPQESTRSGSARLLGRLGPEAISAVPSLHAALDGDAAPLVRGLAAEALGAIGPGAKEAIPSLIAVVRNREKTNYRSLAVTALGAIDATPRADITSVLVAALSDPEEETQGAALEAVRTRGAPGPEVKAALRALQVPANARNEKRYLETMAALHLPVPAGRPVVDEALALAKALTDADVHARGAALLRIRKGDAAIDPRWLPGLTRALTDGDALNRRSGAELLGRAGPAASGSVGALVRALLTSQDAGLEGEIARALVRIAPEAPEALEGLSAHLARGESFRADASASALAAAGAKGVPFLERAVRSKRPYACFAAAGALAVVGPPAVAAVPALLELLADPSRLTIQLTDGGGSSRSRVIAALKAIAPEDVRVKAALAKPN